MKNVLLVSFLFFFASVGALQVVEVYEGGPSVLPFDISTDKWNYYRGETIVLKGQQNINAVCDATSIQFYFKDASGKTRDEAKVNLGPASWMTAWYTLSHDSRDLQPGSYVVEAYATCYKKQGSGYDAGTYLGADGYADADTTPDSIYVTIVEPVGPATPFPTPACTKTCSPGSRLEDAGSASCYCAPVWTLDNGNCELGEPAASKDCTVQDGCPEGKAYSGGACVDIPKRSDLPIELLVIGGLVLVGGFFVLRGGRRGG